MNIQHPFFTSLGYKPPYSLKDVESAVCTIIQTVIPYNFDIDDIKNASSLKDVGADSLDIIVIASKIDYNFFLATSTEKALSLTTLESISTYIYSHLSQEMRR